MRRIGDAVALLGNLVHSSTKARILHTSVISGPGIDEERDAGEHLREFFRRNFT
jgi:hypothetical protein